MPLTKGMSPRGSVIDAPSANSTRRVNPKELANHFNTTVPTVMSWYHTDLIPAVVAVGRIYRFDIEAVEKALSDQSKKGVSK